MPGNRQGEEIMAAGAASGGQAEFRVDRAMVTARQLVYRGGQHGAPGIDEDMIDGEERGFSYRSPRWGKAFTGSAGGVGVAETQQPAELRMVDGGVEVAGQQARGIRVGRQAR
jgi:hypothetical protein